jgi:pimeloyl-ACP methyl ester carboxylesterase
MRSDRVLARQSGPTVVAAYSYGGRVMTALAEDAPNVVALVCIAAFGLDEGESIGALLAQGPPRSAMAHLVFGGPFPLNQARGAHESELEEGADPASLVPRRVQRVS